MLPREVELSLGLFDGCSDDSFVHVECSCVKVPVAILQSPLYLFSLLYGVTAKADLGYHDSIVHLQRSLVNGSLFSTLGGSLT